RARGIDAGSLAELASDPVVLTEVGAAIAAANERLARVQQVKHWRLLPVEGTAETEELTPTLKLRRRIRHAQDADVPRTLYDRPPPPASAAAGAAGAAGPLGGRGPGRQVPRLQVLPFQLQIVLGKTWRARSLPANSTSWCCGG